MRYKKCLVPDCTNTATTRGLCTNCYRAVNIMIKQGEITEEEAMQKGWILPKRKAGAPRRAAVWNQFFRPEKDET